MPILGLNGRPITSDNLFHGVNITAPPVKGATPVFPSPTPVGAASRQPAVPAERSSEQTPTLNPGASPLQSTRALNLNQNTDAKPRQPAKTSPPLGSAPFSGSSIF